MYLDVSRDGATQGSLASPRDLDLGNNLLFSCNTFQDPV